jgi:glycogen debranching enzyme
MADFSGLAETELQLAFACAERGLKKLSVCPPGQKTEGIFAGYPWFFHWWTRDEAFSLGAYLCTGQSQVAKKILFRQIEHGLDNGRIPNRRPDSDLGSADGIGWCAFRFFQLLRSGKIRAAADLQTLADFFNAQLEKLESHFLRNDLIWNAPFETWMDTGTDEDTREGACLEIQCLHQRIQDLTFILARNMNGEVNYFDRRPIIKERFFNGKCLADHIKNNGSVDNTQRPNVFLAAYILPDLLTKAEWKSCFDFALEKLYCDWGGISSIEKDHKLFQPHYTGQNNLSYHRGDSWYWLNNVAALCLWRVDKKHYRTVISKILQASTSELLFSGAPGYHAEVSSAAVQTSDGCLSQAWSMAAYIELLAGIGKS